jgi:GT2 family glycosyltransferase
MELSIVIVNWNSTDLTVNCIRSIQSTTSGIEYEVIVVDNASEGESWRSIPDQLPLVTLIRSHSNIGFARANNLGAERATGKKILFLNPDTIVLGNAISVMVKIVDSNPDIGVLGGHLLNRDLSLQTSCVQRFPTILNQFLTLDWLKRCWPKLPFWGMRALFSEDPNGISDAEVVSGACLMLRREIFDSVGGFSTEYFMYAEEIDLCHIVRESGWRVCHAVKAQVVHFGGQSTKKRGDSFSQIVMRESVFKLLRKFRGNRYAFLYRITVFISALMRLSILLPLTIVPGALLDRQRITWTRKKWSNIARWCLAMENWSSDLVASKAVMVKN